MINGLYVLGSVGKSKLDNKKIKRNLLKLCTKLIETNNVSCLHMHVMVKLGIKFMMWHKNGKLLYLIAFTNKKAVSKKIDN